jgi:hypothetical protein
MPSQNRGDGSLPHEAIVIPPDDQTCATFVINGPGVDPGALTDAVGVPSDHGRVPLGAFEPGGWMVSSRDVVESDDLDDHLAHLLDLLAPSAPLFADLRGLGASARMVCRWDHYRDYPSMFLAEATITRIAELGAHMELDLVRVRDEHDGDDDEAGPGY